MKKKLLICIATIIAIASPIIIHVNKMTFVRWVAMSFTFEEKTAMFACSFMLATTLACEVVASFIFAIGLTQKD